MKKYKLSPWHDASVKPVHIGIYEFNGKFFRKWDGKHWLWGSYSLENAAKNDTYVSIENDEKWRGILKD